MTPLDSSPTHQVPVEIVVEQEGHPEVAEHELQQKFLGEEGLPEIGWKLRHRNNDLSDLPPLVP